MSEPTPNKATFGCFGFLLVGIALVAVIHGLVKVELTEAPENSVFRTASAPRTTMDSALMAGPEVQAVCGKAEPQPRAAFDNIKVPFKTIEWPPEDGDTINIFWREDGRVDDVETVRFFGADTPEIIHPEMGWFEEQPFAYDALDFLAEVLSSAGTIEIARGECLDPYGRTLAYIFVDGENVSAALVSAGLAHETIGKYGPQGFVDEAAEVEAAAAMVEPYCEENPHDFRARMRAQATQSTSP